LKKGLIIAGSLVGAFLILFVGLFAYYQGKADQHNQQVEEANAQLENMSDDDKFRKFSVEAEFVKINGGDYDSNDPYKITGEVSALTGKEQGHEFMLTTEENDGYGVYTVTIMTSEVNISEGDIVTAYGTFGKEKSDVGAPNLIAFLIE
jgi:hypothetical protein